MYNVFFQTFKLSRNGKSMTGPALMAVWSKALPLTASYLWLWVRLTLAMWESCQWLGLWRWFLAGTPVSSTSYNWLVTTWPQYGRRSEENKQNPNSMSHSRDQHSTLATLIELLFRFLSCSGTGDWSRYASGSTCSRATYSRNNIKISSNYPQNDTHAKSKQGTDLEFSPIFCLSWIWWFVHKFSIQVTILISHWHM